MNSGTSFISSVISSSTAGKCDLQFRCDPRAINLVCGTDRVTYVNDCFLAQASFNSNGKIKKAANGRCPCKKTCATVKCGVGVVCRLDPIKCTTECGKEIFMFFQ